MRDRNELRDRLVIGRKGDGRRQYDEAAREELIRLCLQPGVSVARQAIEHDLNPNLLRKWIGLFQQKQRTPRPREAVEVNGVPIEIAAPAVPSAAVTTVAPAFIPVVSVPPSTSPSSSSSSSAVAIALHVRLPNDVHLDLDAANLPQLTAIVQMLGKLTCSASTPG